MNWSWKSVEKAFDHPVTQALITIAITLVTEALAPQSAPKPRARLRSGKAVTRR